MRFIIGMAAAMILLSGCGYSGDLYVTEEQTKAWEEANPQAAKKKSLALRKRPYKEVGGDRLE